MIILELTNNSDLQKNLWRLFIKENEISFSKWIKTLDYVNDFMYRPAYTDLLYFETEQDKMFFLLKYS